MSLRQVAGVESYTFVVIGGGIAGVSVVERIRAGEDDGSILMITESDVVQAASKVNRLTLNLEEFIVVEKTFESFTNVDKNLTILKDRVVSLDHSCNTLVTKSGKVFRYDFLCIATGGLPKLITLNQLDESDYSQYILAIRDSSSISKLAQKLSLSNRILVVGNGGIATEFVYEVKKVNVVWSIKDNSISSHYFDSGAACFLLSSKKYLNQFNSEIESESPNSSKPISKRTSYISSSVPTSKLKNNFCGSALGPDWQSDYILKGLSEGKSVEIEYETEIKRAFLPENPAHLEMIENEFGALEAERAKQWKVFVELTNGKKLGVDWILSATGVVPNSHWFPGDKNDLEGINVNDWMHTSLKDVYAAGDVCYPCWDTSKHWFRMRLWSQARIMGICAGASMCAANNKSNTNLEHYRACNTPTPKELLEKNKASNELFGGFEIFTHVTRFFGFKVVLLGLYNGQGIPKEKQKIQLRCTPNEEYIKIVISENRIQGAILIGDTGLEETFENLILGQIDISVLGDVDILDPNIDLEDYFD